MKAKRPPAPPGERQAVPDHSIGDASSAGGLPNINETKSASGRIIHNGSAVIAAIAKRRFHSDARSKASPSSVKGRDIQVAWNSEAQAWPERTASDTSLSRQGGNSGSLHRATSKLTSRSPIAALPPWSHGVNDSRSGSASKPFIPRVVRRRNQEFCTSDFRPRIEGFER